MDENQNIPQNPDFSDIPSLGDSKGLESYLNNEALASQGLQQTQQEPAAEQPAEQPEQVNNPETITLTREQLNAILASRGQAPVQQPQQRQAAPQQQQQGRGFGYSPQEQQFIADALSKGYSLEQINNFLVSRNRSRINPELERRLAGIENYLQTQEYKAAESAFVNKLTDFGNKWGLSEQDLVTFGNEAYNHGINIAMGNVDLEMVFRAIYPEQYAIRSRRMTPTSTSQIYGGTSIPEGSRASNSKLEDAYVDSFLKGAMPNQYAALNKK